MPSRLSLSRLEDRCVPAAFALSTSFAIGEDTASNAEWISYDPTFAYELAVIIQNGLERMYRDQEDIYYYITVMNENYTHPAMPSPIFSRTERRASAASPTAMAK